MTQAATCAVCRRALGPGETKPMPLIVAIPATVALAFMHGGMWAHEELSRPHCARCRARLIPLVVFVSALALAAISVGVALWIDGP